MIVFYLSFKHAYLNLENSTAPATALSMEDCWRYISPPKKEEEIEKKWVGCIFNSRKTENFFVGRIVRRFLSDDTNGYVCALEVDCLQQKYGVGDNILKEYEEGKKDVGIFPIYDIICGPLEGEFLGNRKWLFKQYGDIKAYFEAVKKEDRKFQHQQFVCSYHNT